MRCGEEGLCGLVLFPLNCVVTRSVYSPSARSAGTRKMSLLGSFTASMSVVIFVTVPVAAEVSVTPTSGASPATLRRAPVRMKLRPAVAVNPMAPVAESCPPMMYMALPFSPMMFTEVSPMAARRSPPWVKDT